MLSFFIDHSTCEGRIGIKPSWRSGGRQQGGEPFAVDRIGDGAGFKRCPNDIPRATFTPAEIVGLSDRLYRDQHLRRVYYSAFVPVPRPDKRLPRIEGPPLVRDNRLYQADWLIRLYGFSLDEVIDRHHPDLDLAINPKFACR